MVIMSVQSKTLFTMYPVLTERWVCEKERYDASMIISRTCVYQKTHISDAK